MFTRIAPSLVLISLFLAPDAARAGRIEAVGRDPQFVQEYPAACADAVRKAIRIGAERGDVLALESYSVRILDFWKVRTDSVPETYCKVGLEWNAPFETFPARLPQESSSGAASGVGATEAAACESAERELAFRMTEESFDSFEPRDSLALRQTRLRDRKAFTRADGQWQCQVSRESLAIQQFATLDTSARGGARAAEASGQSAEQACSAARKSIDRLAASACDKLGHVADEITELKPRITHAAGAPYRCESPYRVLCRYAD